MEGGKYSTAAMARFKIWAANIAQRQKVDHKRELEAVAKMPCVREQGFSFWKIADVLNTMKVPTQTRQALLAVQVGLVDYLRVWPNELSGGQRQGNAIARILITETHHFLADQSVCELR
ncbi:MAG: hypothetical protein NTV34_17155 [Proteobacteria bacterium]|nr:hypothetical protein [Pseudomonadota bacterium]